MNLLKAEGVEDGRCGYGHTTEEHNWIENVLLNKSEPYIHHLEPCDGGWTWREECHKRLALYVGVETCVNDR